MDHVDLRLGRLALLTGTYQSALAVQPQRRHDSRAVRTYNDGAYLIAMIAPVSI